MILKLSSHLDLTKTVHIYGAGIAGLLMAYQLKKKAIPFKIYESEKRVGGKIQTRITEFGLIESAANGIVKSPNVSKLLEDLGLNYIYPREKLSRYIYRDNKFKKFPFSITESCLILKNLFSTFPQGQTQSIQEFFSNLLPPSAEDVLTTVLQGIHANSINTLSFQDIFPTPVKSKTYWQYFKEIKRKERIKTISFNNGMQELINALENKLKENIIYNNQNQAAEKNSIICTNAHEAAQLIKSRYPKIAEQLDQIQYNSLCSWTFFCEKELSQLKKSFGVLISPQSGFLTLGVLSNHEIFPHRTKNDLKSYTVIYKPQEIEQTKSDIENIFSTELDLHHIKHNASTLWEKALPVYNLKRLHAINKINELYSKQNIDCLIFGNYTHRISIREMIEASYEMISDL